jgi:ABC-type molybdate transport system ATPase subunit
MSPTTVGILKNGDYEQIYLSMSKDEIVNLEDKVIFLYENKMKATNPIS